MDESTDFASALEQLPVRDDWLKPYSIESHAFLPTAHIMPCTICGAMMLVDRNAVEMHLRWHDGLGK